MVMHAVAVALHVAAFGRYITGFASAPAEEDLTDSYRLLGAEQGCTEDELKSAYRQKVSQWHPDRLEGMAPELRQLATEQMTRINEAYEKLNRLSSGIAQE
jgi:DnaJ like chaperone protein